MSIVNRIRLFFWRAIQRKKLARKGIKLSRTTYFDANTNFGGINKIGKHTSICGSEIGRFTYMVSYNRLENVKIGNFCSLGQNITIINTLHPSKDFVSTHPAFYSTGKQAGKSFALKDTFSEHSLIEGRKVIIGNDVWIGSNATLMGGIKIGDGAIVGANSLVTKDIPPYAIVGGVPAKVIRYRFTPEQIEKIEKVQWWDKDDEWLESRVKQFQSIEIFIKDIQSE